MCVEKRNVNPQLVNSDNRECLCELCTSNAYRLFNAPLSEYKYKCLAMLKLSLACLIVIKTEWINKINITR